MDIAVETSCVFSSQKKSAQRTDRRSYRINARIQRRIGLSRNLLRTPCRISDKTAFFGGAIFTSDDAYPQSTNWPLIRTQCPANRSEVMFRVYAAAGKETGIAQRHSGDFHPVTYGRTQRVASPPPASPIDNASARLNSIPATNSAD